MSTQSNVTGSLQQQDIEQVAALVHVDAQGSEPIARNLPATAPTNASSNAQEAAERELPAADESQEETLALDEKDPGDEDELATQDEQGAESPVQVAEAPVGSAAPDAMSDVYLAQAPEGSDLQGAQIEQLYEDEEEEDEDDDALLYLWDWGLLSAGALIAMNDWDSWGGPAAPPPPAPPPASAVAITSITDDSGRYDNDFVTSDQTLTISGTSNAADGATVQVKVNDEVVGTATVMGGAWSFVYETELMDGNYTLGADLLDAEDSIVASAADQNLVIDTSGTEDENGDPDPIADEEIAVSSISDDTGPYSDDFVTNDQALVINGTSTAADGAHVAVKVDGNIVGYTTVDGDGAWSFNYTGTMLAIGTYTLDADLVDLAGNVAVSAADQSLVIDTSGTEDENGDPDPLANAEITVYAVTDDTGTAGDLTTTDQTLEIYGESTADTGSHVAVKVNGNIVGYTTVDGDGAWSFDYTGTTLPVGTYTLDADLVDLAGNVAATAEDRTLVVEAASEETPLALTTSLNGVTNLDVKSALVLNFNQDISLSDGQIRILDMMGTSGWTLSNISTDVSRQDVTGNDVVITLADGVVTGMTIGGVDYTALGTNGISLSDLQASVSISGNQLIIDPAGLDSASGTDWDFDFDFGADYRLEIDANLVQSTSGLVNFAGVSGTDIEFTTVAPAGDATGAASQKLNASGALEASYTYHHGHVSNTEESAYGMDFSSGSHVLVIETAGGTTRNLGIGALGGHINLTGFSANDLIYNDNMGNMSMETTDGANAGRWQLVAPDATKRYQDGANLQEIVFGDFGSTGFDETALGGLGYANNDGLAESSTYYNFNVIVFG